MEILKKIFIALGLAIDAFAVSIAKGISINNQKLKNGLIFE